MLNKLLLLSGNDIPFIGGRVNIHQPKIKEIALIGQRLFYLGSNFLCFSKDNLDEKDKNNLANQTNFDILMSIINMKVQTMQESIVAAKMILSLIFPDYQLKIMPNMLLLTKVLEDGTKEQCMINNDNYEQFKSILKEMFCLISQSQKYNPANKKAAQIAKKLQNRQKMLSKKSQTNEGEINVLYHYILIISLGNHQSIPELMEYTLYQLFHQFNRFNKKYSYEAWFKAKLAGAENLDDIDHWLSLEDEENKSGQTLPKSNKIEF